MKKVLSITVLSLLLLLHFSCVKEGPGGKATIAVTVKHHAAVIPGASVYIKYDATEMPGTVSSDYDDGRIADENGKVRFEGLKRGAYYMYATGWDSAISQTVSGGLHIHIKYSERKDVIEEIIPVTE